VAKAIEEGYLANAEPKLGIQSRIVCADELPEEVEVLPSADSLSHAVQRCNGSLEPETTATLQRPDLEVETDATVQQWGF